MRQDAHLPWNHSLVQLLSMLLTEERLGHAYLFHGAPGLGKYSALMDFAELLFCQNASSENACGSCQGCRLFQAGTHPDFLHLRREEDATQIKIEQIRDSQSFIGNTPMLGKHKILLIEPAEHLNINAANALLKNLEEPAKGTLIFLICHQPSTLLATIRSRCQGIKFFLPTKNESLTYLQQYMSADQAEQALLFSRGAPLKAQKLVEDGVFQEYSEIQQSLLDLLREDISVSEVAANWEKMDNENLLDSLLTTIDIMTRFIQAEASDWKGQPLSKALKSLINIIDVKHLTNLHDFYLYLLQLRAKLRGRSNPNRLLLFEALSLQWIEKLSR
jgi:DNA polymerase-3 subunit delta'